MSDINSNNADNTVIFSGTKEVAENLKFDEKRLKQIVQVEEYKAYSEAIRKIYISS